MAYKKALMILVVSLLLIAGARWWLTDSVPVALSATNNQSVDVEQQVLEAVQNGGTADIVIQFAGQANLDGAENLDWRRRGEWVYQALVGTADQAQEQVINEIVRRGNRYYSSFAGNRLFVWEVDQELLTWLASLPEVVTIRAPRSYTINQFVKTERTNLPANALEILAMKAKVTVLDNDQPQALTWSVEDTNADQFWNIFGFEGEGIVVATIDTGVQYDHPALDQAYKCLGDPGNPACWYDPSNICGGTPCDNNGHGTATMGPIVADNDPTLPYQAGMAPGAQWIACKGCESSACSEFALTSCADWALAPGGDPDNRPQVVSNSWGGGGCNDWFEPYVDAWMAAGIAATFSPGGSGPGCGTIGSPGDYQSVFASTAHDEQRNISSFASRGPSCFGHDPFTKPNISAPGVNICTPIPTDGWTCGYSGTSFSNSFGAGGMVLLLSCSPDLIGLPYDLMAALQNTADTPPDGNCGAPPDGEGNYTYGYGYLNLLTAGEANCDILEFGMLEGFVYDPVGNPIEGADVSAQHALEGTGIMATTDPNGYYTMTLAVGLYDVTAYKADYSTQTQYGVEVISGTTVPLPDFILSPLDVWTMLDPLPGCPDWTRYDGEYYSGNGLIYFMGGRSGTETLPDIYALDPTTLQCVDTGADMGTAISNYTIVTINVSGTYMLCTFGGRDPAGGFTDAVQCFDPLTNSVTQPTVLPPSLGSFIPAGAEAVNGKAYIFGGFQSNAPPYETSETWEWDPSTNTWTQLGDLALGLGYIQTAVVDDLIYGFGGTVFDGTNLFAQTIAQVFDPTIGEWTQIADLPTAGAEGRAFGFDSDSIYELAGQIIVAGGGQWPNDTNSVYAYDIATNTYDDTFADLNITRRDQAGVFVQGNPGLMWVFGGRSSELGYGGDNPPYAPPEYYGVLYGIPEIAVDPTFLDKTVLVDTPATVNLNIMNQGGGLLEWLLYDDGSTLEAALCEIIGDVPWLSTDPVAGSTPAGYNTPVDVTFDPTGMGVGEYYATLCAASNDPVNPIVSIPITMTVIDLTVGVTLTPESQALPGDPGQVVIYNLELENTGNYPDLITFEATGVWEVNLPVTSFELAVGEVVSVEVQVTVPTEAMAGDSDLTTVIATSANDPSVFDTSELTTTANQTYGVLLTPDLYTQYGDPGQIVTYTLTVTNTGNGVDTIDFSYVGNSWDVYLPVSSFNLVAGASTDISVQVTLPGDVMPDMMDVVIITATAGDGGTAESALTTVANTFYAFELAPAIAALSGAPGETVTYTLQLSNLGNVADSFMITITLDVWEVYIPVMSFDITVGESVDVLVLVTVAPNAEYGDVDIITITATSNGNGSSVSSILTTKVMGEVQTVGLPIVYK